MKPVYLSQQIPAHEAELLAKQMHFGRLTTIDSQDEQVDYDSQRVPSQQQNQLETADSSVSPQEHQLDSSLLLMRSLQQQYLASMQRYRSDVASIAQQTQQRSFLKGEGRYRLDLSVINTNHNSDHSLRVSASDREIEHIKEIVDQINCEVEGKPVSQQGSSYQQGFVGQVKAQGATPQQSSESVFTKRRNKKQVSESEMEECYDQILQKDEEIISLKQQLYICEQNDKHVRGQLDCFRRMNYDLCKQNTQLIEEVARLQKLLRPPATPKGEPLMPTPLDSTRWTKIDKKAEQPAQDLAKTMGSPKAPCKKYDSVVLRLTDENKQLRQLVGQLTQQNAALAKQLQIQQAKTQSILGEARTLRLTIETLLKRPSSVVATGKVSNTPTNPQQVNEIRNELRALSTKLNKLNSRAAPADGG